MEVNMLAAFENIPSKHSSVLAASTKYRLPVNIITDPIFFEMYLKYGSGRAFLNKKLI